MRFLVLRDEMRVPGQSLFSSIQRAAEIMDAYDKARPDYQDPAKLEETIQKGTDAAVLAERNRIIDCLAKHLGKGRNISALHESLLVLFGDVPESEMKGVFRG